MLISVSNRGKRKTLPLRRQPGLTGMPSSSMVEAESGKTRFPNKWDALWHVTETLAHQ